MLKGEQEKEKCCGFFGLFGGGGGGNKTAYAEPQPGDPGYNSGYLLRCWREEVVLV